MRRLSALSLAFVFAAAAPAAAQQRTQSLADATPAPAPMQAEAPAAQPATAPTLDVSPSVIREQVKAHEADRSRAAGPNRQYVYLGLAIAGGIILAALLLG
jgi:hypothetical protein